MGRCLKRWQLSRDNDCLVGFLLHSRTKVAAFVVTATLHTYSDTLCASVMYCSTAFWKILPTTFIPDVWIIGFVKNKGIIKRPSSLLFFCPPLIFQVLCCPCWVNNFPSFVGNWKDKHRIPWVTQSRNTHRLTWMLEHTCMEQSTHTEFWLTTMPPLLSLDSCTGAEHASCWWKIIYQSLRCHCGNLFFSKYHLHRELLVHAVLF